MQERSQRSSQPVVSKLAEGGGALFHTLLLQFEVSLLMHFLGQNFFIYNFVKIFSQNFLEFFLLIYWKFFKNFLKLLSKVSYKLPKNEIYIAP